MNLLSQRRIADLHAETDWQVGQSALQGFRLKASDVKKRRAIGSPDALVLLGRFFGTSGQNTKVQNEPPQKTRRFNHARIAQKLPQIATQSGNRRCIRRAELNEKNAGSCRRASGEWWVVSIRRRG